MKTLEELMALRDAAKAQMTARDDSTEVTRIVVGMATCGIAAGARPVMAKFVEETAKRGLKHVTVSQTGCIGMCQYEPIAEVLVPGEEKVTYVQLTEEKVARIVADHIVNGNPVYEYTVGAVTK
ncbi:MAG: (2Fe-2S) ferredoxin domain-containing protein [Oscillospiraceae bacterium]|nr:(2Fe-2S) ferredoxin domain-containing protein [Oscillospiraceae bacterium]MDD6146988.1 (2Fe-2S) ferredoxin domain-containing protein [Oscillospiraceae bacterium]